MVWLRMVVVLDLDSGLVRDTQTRLGDTLSIKYVTAIERNFNTTPEIAATAVATRRIAIAGCY